MVSPLQERSQAAPTNAVQSQRSFSTILWSAAIVGLALLLILLPRSPLPWFDEVLMESTALSIAHGKPAVPSVLGAFPETKSFGLFFGPVGLGLGAADVKLFGVSLVAWRTIGWLGALGVTLLAAWVTKRLTGSLTAAAATAALVAFSQGVGARATSGRLDTIAVFLEFAALGFAISSLQASGNRTPYICAMGCGLFCGLSILSTPRSFPFALSLFFAFGFEIVCNRIRARRPLIEMLLAGAIVGILILAWTSLEKTDPVNWLRFLLGASHSDTINVSPLLGGAWHLLDGPLPERLAGMVFIPVFVLVIGAAVHSIFLNGNGLNLVDRGTLRFALLAGATNYFVTFLLISRFWDYDVFVIPLLLPVVVSLSYYLLCLPRKRSRKSVAILGFWLVWASTCVFIRCGKVLVWAWSYQQRDMAGVTQFVATNIPQRSVVFGPRDFYFYAVENCGSLYLYPRPWISAGLGVALASSVPAWDELLSKGNVYLIWPTASSLPKELIRDRLLPVARFEPRHKVTSRLVAAIGMPTEGYPPTTIYRVYRRSPVEPSLGSK